MIERHPWTSHSIDGRQVEVALRDGTRLDDCQLVSRGRTTVDSVWLFAEGADLVVPLTEVVDIRPVAVGAHREA